MNKIINKVKKSALLKLSFLYVVSLFAHTSLYAQGGKDLFKTNCAACHSVGANKLVGPGLEGVNEKRTREWLLKWTKNSSELIASGDADAKAIFEEFNKIPMPAQALSDEQLNEIYDYIANPNAETAVAAKEEAPKAEGASEEVLLGEKLFKANCAACHSVGDNKLVGPGLKGINEKRNAEWLVKWITNSAELIASGDADAKAIFEEFNKVPMPAQAVSPDEIKAILAYIKNPPVKAGDVAQVEEAATETKSDSKATMIILIIIIVVLAGLIMLLNKSRVSIAKAAANKEGVEYAGPISFAEACKYTVSKNKGIVAAVVIVLVFGGLLNLMDGALTIGVHTGYKPEQPIKFSHKVHAGDNKIDCNYCHSSARHSKTSGIPSLNVCMNCHKYVDGSNGKTFTYNGEEYPMTDEIKKIYKHLDYNPETQAYGNNPTPVKWIKVHNLPDHVYYSHQQHVTVGGQKCQTCHGPVEEMDVVEQYSPLTMKWCIQCHHETGVVTEGNGYYEEMHSRMTEQYKDKWLGDGKLTVEEIGGWECAKCHY
ncbi:MAG: c-type cytochrome [Flavobacteriales bacterium]|nr:c-type cytochrome [Flavobacteriales bacterium]MCB9173048.1 c-type cytochrome [Flavobacteriales bacterium]